jgi:hypothetical protein
MRRTYSTNLGLAWFHYNLFEGDVPFEICANVLPNGVLEFLQADCGPEDNPAQECACCSACCDRQDVCYETGV